MYRHLKPRIFLIERNEPTDEEVFNNIGNEMSQLKANPDYTASDKEKKAEKLKDVDGTGFPPPIFLLES